MSLREEIEAESYFEGVFGTTAELPIHLNVGDLIITKTSKHRVLMIDDQQITTLLTNAKGTTTWSIDLPTFAERLNGWTGARVYREIYVVIPEV